MATYFFCGIAGSGMSALAQLLRHQGHEIIGSDRSIDRGENEELAGALLEQEIMLVPQDGQAVDDDVDMLVVSSAVETKIPDVQAAMHHGVPVVKRAELLAEHFNAGAGIAIGGTSGKSTVTAMVGHILRGAGRKPSVVNGAIMVNAQEPPWLGNAICGDPSLMVIEADESDGTIALYRPKVGVVTNLTLDHKPLPELRELFGRFCEQTRDIVVLNADDEETMALADRARQRVLTFGFCEAANVRGEELILDAEGCRFKVDGLDIGLRQLGKHNAQNALAAIAAALAMDIPVKESAKALATFDGVARRLQLVGQANGITVYDDFAHNPEKIAAALGALQITCTRMLVVYQPHGFGPTKFLKDGLIRAFAACLRENDWLVMPEIYYAGGTADQDISSQDLVEAIASVGRQAAFVADRREIPAWLAEHAEPGDMIVVMGARDPGLPAFAQAILATLSD